MHDVVLSILGGSAAGAVVTGLFAILQYWIKRRDQKKDKQADKDDSNRKALRYLMLYIIQERAKDHIRDNRITLDDRRSLHHWHDLYHNGLGGNGDADALMAQIDKLQLETDA